MRIPNLYLKWHAFVELVDLVDKDTNVGQLLFKDPDGGQPFSKLLRGDLGLTPEIASELVGYMNENIARRAARQQTSRKTFAVLRPQDLEMPALAFAAHLISLAPWVAPERLDRMHKALVRDMTLSPPAHANMHKLAVERFDQERSFGSFKPSGGAGPTVFEAGKHKGQLAVIEVEHQPLAAYTMITRDPAPLGKRIWELSWGETVLWLPAPSHPKLAGSRLPLMPGAEPVQPMPGHFHVTSALVWKAEAQEALDPRNGSPQPGAMDEVETALFLTRLRRMTEDKRGKWAGAVTVATAEYLVHV